MKLILGLGFLFQIKNIQDGVENGSQNLVNKKHLHNSCFNQSKWIHFAYSNVLEVTEADSGIDVSFLCKTIQNGIQNGWKFALFTA